jgi:chromosome segregation ATPase
MSYSNSDLQRVEREITDIQRSIDGLEREEQRAKMSLLKANSEVQYMRKNLDKAQAEFQKAERDVHEINDEQAQIAKEKALLATKLTGKNAEKARIDADIRNAAARESKK